MNPVAAILQQIVQNRQRRLEGDVGKAVLPRVQGENCRLVENDFTATLRRNRGHAVIAEVKMGSPRIGSLEGRLDPVRQAETYAHHGAAALSVVVEPDFFFGSYELLSACRRASGLPTLAKDFVVHPVQLQWARQAGADAILLIAAVMSTDQLAAYAGYARSLGLVPLIEVHDGQEVARLAQSPVEVVGVNNRDLRTFEVDLQHSMDLVGSLPEGALRVSESGIARGFDVERLANAGFDAFLVGESLLLAEDPGAKLGELTGRR